jgi:hypothetical protein
MCKSCLECAFCDNYNHARTGTGDTLYGCYVDNHAGYWKSSDSAVNCKTFIDKSELKDGVTLDDLRVKAYEKINGKFKLLCGSMRKVQKDSEETRGTLKERDNYFFDSQCRKEAREDLVKICGIDGTKADKVIELLRLNKLRHIYMMY